MRQIADRVLRALQRAAGAYSRDDCSQFAAAISFRVLFAVFPFVILLVSILGLVLQDDEVRSDVIDWIEQTVPLAESALGDLERTIDGLATPLSAAGLVSLLGLLWSASGLAASVQTALNRIFRAPRARPAARAKLFDFALIGLAGLLVLVSFGLTIVTDVVQDYARDSVGVGELGEALEVAGRATELLIPFLITYGTFLAVYHLVPVVRPRLADLWLGAAVAAVGFEAFKVGFAYYLSNFSRYNVIYGSLGAVVAFLFFVYLAASVFLFGAELASAWPGSTKPDEGPGVPFKQQVKGFLRRLFVNEEEREHEERPL